MTLLRFEPESRVTIRRRHYRDPRPTAEGYEMTDEITGESRLFSQSILETERSSGLLHYDPSHYAKDSVVARKRGVLSDQWNPSDAQKELAQWRQYFCKRFSEKEKEGLVSRTRESLQSALQLIYQEYLQLKQREKPVPLKGGKGGRNSPDRLSRAVVRVSKQRSWRTAQRWLRAARNGGQFALRPGFGRCGNRFSRFSTEVTSIMNRYVTAYEAENRPTIKSCYGDMADEFERLNKERSDQNLPTLQTPSLSAFRSRLHEENQFRQYAKRHGTSAAIAKFYGSLGGAKAERPLERCEIDECKVDLFAFVTDRRIFDLLAPEEREKIERARYWFTRVVDCATRYDLALAVSPAPSAASALRALKMAMSSKTAIADFCGASSPWSVGGLITELFADNGSAFISDEFRRACEFLGIILTHTPAGWPQLRAVIERSFRSLTLEAIAPFLGRSYSNSRERGDYPSKSRTCLTVDELVKVMVRASVDIGHNLPHRGLKDETPLYAMHRKIDKYGLPPPPARVKEIVAFGVEKERKTEIRGVVFAGLWYHNKELQQHRMQHDDMVVPICVDPDMLSGIAVKLDGDWVLIPAVDQDEARVSLPERVREIRHQNALFAKQAKVTAPVVRKARTDFRAMREHGAEIADILAPLWGDTEVQLAERQVLLGFEIVHGGDDRPNGLGEEIPTSGPINGGPGLLSAADVSTPPSARNQKPKPSNRMTKFDGCELE